jgi:hypothetical protein
MNRRIATSQTRRERGFILATVLIFLVVLSLSAFLGAKLTRTDIQVVNNLQNEKEALAIAEAGIHEALYRMSLAIGDSSTVNGRTFDASLAPIVPGRLGPPLPTPSYGINYANTQSTSQIIFTANAPSTGTNNVVPTLQPTSLQIPYSFSTGDAVPVDLSATARLTIGWDLCPGPNAASGCDNVLTSPTHDPFYPIRGLPISSPRAVVKVVSTGRSGAATRKITAGAVDCIPNSTPGNGALVTLDNTCPSNPAAPGGINFNGTNHLSASGMVQVNAGGVGTCPNALRSGGSGSSLSGNSINVSGTTSGNGTFTPAPTTGGLPQADPYARIQPPCYTGGQGAICQGNAVTDVQYDGTAQPRPNTNSPLAVTTNGAVLQPGIYYGGIDITASNVVMMPGIYIMAGGGLSVGNSATLSSADSTTTPSCTVNCGVMIYNTLDSVHPSGAAPGSFSLTNGNTNPHLAAIQDPNSPFAGVVFFQERAPATASPADPYPGRLPLTQPPLQIQGGSAGRALDGLVYAPDAALNVSGTNTIPVGGALIVKSADFAGGSGLNVQLSNNGLPGAACGGIAYQIIGWQDF